MKDFRKLFQLILPYKKYAIGNVVFNFLGTVFSVVSIALLMPFLDILFDKTKEVATAPEFRLSVPTAIEYFKYFLTQIKQEQGAQTTILYVGLFILIAIILKNLFVYGALYIITPLRQYIIRDYRNKFYSKLLRLPISYFNNERKGDLISRFTNDITQVEWSVLMALESLFKEPISVIVFLTALFIASTKLTLIVFLVLPLAGIFIAGIGKILRRESKIRQSILGNIITHLEETIGGMRIIKAFNNEETMRNRMLENNKHLTTLSIKTSRLGDASSPLSEVFGIFAVVILLWFGGRMVLNQQMEASAFIIYLGLFSQVISPAKAISNATNLVKRGSASLDRIEEILAAEETISNKPNPIILKSFEKSIEFKNVSFKYREEYVLRNINLVIEKGKTVALVGPSGSGKSTLADLIPRFYDIEEGEVLIDGINVKDYEMHSMRSVMGIVTQESLLFNDSIKSNIAFGMPNKTEAEILQAAKVANALEFIDQSDFGFETNIGERGSKLSGGQRQRISIARAVLKNPDILILDEATSALDTTSERLVQQALDNLMHQRTSIVIAHRLTTIQNADLIVVLSEGEIKQQGSHSELLAHHGIYKELYRMQE